MIASLPMYDWPEIKWATDQWWGGVARHLGVGIPLTREADFQSVWRRDDLVLSQTCGYPFTHEFRGALQLVATPHYAAKGCEGAYYCSFIFARENAPIESFRGSTAAMNSLDSMSGMLALKLVCGRSFFQNKKITGSHLASLIAVQNGSADLCAIDAVCVELAKQHRPELLEGLHVVGQSPQVPGLPYVTRGSDVVALRAALQVAMADETLKDARTALLINGLSVLSPADYDLILKLENALDS